MKLYDETTLLAEANTYDELYDNAAQFMHDHGWGCYEDDVPMEVIRDDIIHDVDRGFLKVVEK